MKIQLIFRSVNTYDILLTNVTKKNLVLTSIFYHLTGFTFEIRPKILFLV